MADSQKTSDTDVYNAGYIQANDSETLTSNYNDTPPSTGQQQVIEQQPQCVDLHALKYWQNPVNYGQQSRGDLNAGRGQQLSFVEQRHPFIEQYTTIQHIQQPIYTRSYSTGGDCNYLSCLAFLVCLCCFWPASIAALIYAQKAVDAYKDGNIEDGKRYRSITHKLICVSVVVPILVGAVYVMIRYFVSNESTSLT